MEKIIPVQENIFLREVFGVEDKNLKFLEKKFGVVISLKTEGVSVKGDKKRVENALFFINKFIELKKQGLVLNRDELSQYLDSTDFQHVYSNFESEERKKEGERYGIKIASARKQYVLSKTKGQKEYIQSMKEYDIVFSLGPAGTGKTYLAMAMAVNFLLEKQIRRIILTRPAIEAGESLGFLPGDIHEKLGPYLRPLYDALYDMMEAEVIEEYLAAGIIEIVPLAYMRGRTLNNAFVILDEAQNCTSEQLKMFLTRLGFDSKTVITGDITQSDLPGGKPTGLIEAVKILKLIKGIKFIFLSRSDVVRHPLIQKIIQAYEDFHTEKTDQS